MIRIPQRLLGEALLNSVGKNSSKTAIIIKGAEYSYFQLKEDAEKLADYLIKSGIRKGDRVAICMNNSWPTIVSVYGATLAGAVFVIINPQTKADKLGYILKDTAGDEIVDCINTVLGGEKYIGTAMLPHHTELSIDDKKKQ